MTVSCGCPVSVKRTIADEIEKHLPKAVYELMETSRVNNWEADIYIAGLESISQSLSLNFVLLDLVQKRRCFIVVDESSLVKNHMAKRTREIWRLGERAQYKLILSGTPVTNNEQDLSQWYFLDPRILATSFYSSLPTILSMILGFLAEWSGAQCGIPNSQDVAVRLSGRRTNVSTFLKRHIQALLPIRW